MAYLMEKLLVFIGSRKTLAFAGWTTTVATVITCDTGTKRKSHLLKKGSP